jgi:hypothetical protein
VLPPRTATSPDGLIEATVWTPVLPAETGFSFEQLLIVNAMAAMANNVTKDLVIISP